MSAAAPADVRAVLQNIINTHEQAGKAQAATYGVGVANSEALGATTLSAKSCSGTDSSTPLASLSPAVDLAILSTGEGSPFERLPTELHQQITVYLGVREIISLRLMSRRFAELCAPQLFKTGFSLRPHRYDMIRLARVALNPEIAKGIKYLRIYMGDMSMDQFLVGINNGKFMSFPDKEAMLPIFQLFDPATLHCKKEALRAIFSLLPNLRSVSAMSQTSPFWDLYDEDVDPTSSKHITRMNFEAVWDDMEDCHASFGRNNFLNPPVSIERYTNVLLSALKIPVPLKNLELESFPIDCFSEDLSHFSANDTHEEPKDVQVNTSLLGKFKKAVAGVEKLEIGLIGSGDPSTFYCGPKLPQALGKFLGSMTNLRSLLIDWMVEEDMNDSFTLSWDKSFSQLHFQHLEDLRIANFETPREFVMPFILRHAKTLKRLSWSIPDSEDDFNLAPGQEPEAPTWRANFTEFRDKLKLLECCELLTEDDWGNLYYKNWEPEPADHIRVPCSKLLELFVLGKLPWPMKKDNPHFDRGWMPKHSESYQYFLLRSEEELQNLYSEDWETDKESGATTSDSEDEDDDEEGFDDDEDMSGEDTMDLDVEHDEWEDMDDENDEDDEDEDEIDFETMPHLLMAALAYDLDSEMGDPTQ